jgi:quinol monooxygenase YgiN
MFAPIVFISHFKVKDGKLKELRAHSQKATELLDAQKPGTVAYLLFLSQDGTELSIVHVFPDAEAFDRHVEGVAERFRAALEFIVPTRRELYGTPSDSARALLEPPEGSAISLTVIPQPMTGYMRLKAA